MSYYDDTEKESMQEVTNMLSKPQAEAEVHSIDDFDPWEIFPLYGSYSSAFDDMAITTLENILAGRFIGETLASEMFREMLCSKELCDYGTSPRVCFPKDSFEKILPQYIDKWKQYYELQWGRKYDEEKP